MFCHSSCLHRHHRPAGVTVDYRGRAPTFPCPRVSKPLPDCNLGAATSCGLELRQVWERQDFIFIYFFIYFFSEPNLSSPAPLAPRSAFQPPQVLPHQASLGASLLELSHLARFGSEMRDGAERANPGASISAAPLQLDPSTRDRRVEIPSTFRAHEPRTSVERRKKKNK